MGNKHNKQGFCAIAVLVFFWAQVAIGQLHLDGPMAFLLWHVIEDLKTAVFLVPGCDWGASCGLWLISDATEGVTEELPQGSHPYHPQWTRSGEFCDTPHLQASCD